LVLAPFQRAIKEAAIYDDQWQLTLSTALGAVAVVVVILFYQTITVWLWGATVGKVLMGLSVKNVWEGEKIRLSQSLTRATYWILSWLFLGIPFLSVFSNFRRRPLHDRISDTFVTSLREGRSVLAPSHQEFALVRGVYWAFGTCISLLLFAGAVSTLSSWQKQTELISSLEDENVLCASVSEAQSEWPQENGHEAERLSVAMGLYASGSVDRKCLEGEVENLFSADEESSLLYLAKSFVYADNSELSDRYLEKVCNMNEKSDECRISRVIQNVAENNWQKMEAEFRELTNQSPIYAKIWAARQFLHRENYKMAEEFINRIPNIHGLSDFMVPAQAKILWGLNKKEEALGTEIAAYSTTSDEAKLDLASFMCFEQIWSQCGGLTSKSCSEFGQLVGSLDDSLSGLKSSMTYLRKWECEQKGHADYERLMSLPLHEDVKSLAAALSSQNTDGFSELLDDTSIDESFANEVSRRMIERTKSASLLKVIGEDWEKSRHTLAWQKVGETLFTHYFTMKNYPESIHVADVLLGDDTARSKELIEKAVVASIRGGQVERARQFFIQYAQRNPLPTFNAAREPASLNDVSAEFLEAAKKFMEKGL
jgi:hypothetical protein